MRILHIMASRAPGAAETYAAEIMRGLHEAGIAQTVVVPEGAACAVLLARAGLVPASNVLRSSFARSFRLHRLIAKSKPDAIHCWMRAGASLAPKTKIPTIGWSGRYDEPAPFARCAYIVGATAAIARHMAAKTVIPERVHAIPFFAAAPTTAPFDRRLLATPKEARVLLSLARLHPDQGLDGLLAALKELPGAYVWLAGEGPARFELETLAASLGIAERVRFLGGSRSNRMDHGALLRAADALVLPARRELFGTSVLEAWAAGTPVIAASSEGTAELIADGGDGFLVPAGDASALVAGIRRLLGDEGLRQRVIAGGYATYVKNYAYEVVIRRWIEFYQRITA